MKTNCKARTQNLLFFIFITIHIIKPCKPKKSSKLDGVPKKVGLPLKSPFICALLLSLLQLSFNHLNKHFLCFNLGNLLERNTSIDVQSNCITGQDKHSKHSTITPLSTWTFPCGSLSSINCSWIALGKSSKRFNDWSVSFFFHSPPSSTVSWARISLSSAIRCWTCNQKKYKSDIINLCFRLIVEEQIQSIITQGETNDYD